MATVRRRVVVRGRVQGVFFRDSVRQRAQARQVTGWAANRPDGTVEAVFEGDPEAVSRLVDYVHIGPPQANVEHVEVSEEPPEGLQGFRVR